MYTIKYLFYSSIYIKLIVLFLFISLTTIITIGLSKIKRLLMIKNYIKSFEQQFWSGIELNKFYEANHENNLNHPLGMIFKAVYEEWSSSENIKKIPEARQDIKERMSNAAHGQKILIMQICENYLDLLSAFIHIIPFVGLLGTIFGLIDVFYNLDLENGITLTNAGIGIGGSMICLVFSLIAVIIAMFLFWFFNMEVQKISDNIDKYILDLLNIFYLNLNNNVQQDSSPKNIPEKTTQQQETKVNKKNDDVLDDDV